MSKFTHLDAFLLLCSIFTYIVDVALDVILAVTYFSDGYYAYGTVTAALAFVPTVAVQVFSVRWHEIDEVMNGATWVIHTLLLGVIHRYLVVISLGMEAMHTGDSVDYARYYQQWSDVCMLRLFDSFLESAPQLVFHLYVMMVRNGQWPWEQAAWTALSALASMVSLGWGIAAYSSAMRMVRTEKGKMTLIGMILQTVWRVSMLAARITAMVLLALALEQWVIIVLFVHWLAMTLWVVYQNTDFCTEWWEERLYNAIVGVIYCFCFFNLKEGASRVRSAIFYVVTVAENLSFVAIYALCNGGFGGGGSAVADAGLAIVVSGTVLGLASMLLYYRFFHPAGPFHPCSEREPKEKLSSSSMGPDFVVEEQLTPELGTAEKRGRNRVQYSRSFKDACPPARRSKAVAAAVTAASPTSMMSSVGPREDGDNECDSGTTDKRPDSAYATDNASSLSNNRTAAPRNPKTDCGTDSGNASSPNSSSSAAYNNDTYVSVDEEEDGNKVGGGGSSHVATVTMASQRSCSSADSRVTVIEKPRAATPEQQQQSPLKGRAGKSRIYYQKLLKRSPVVKDVVTAQVKRTQRMSPPNVSSQQQQQLAAPLTIIIPNISQKALVSTSTLSANAPPAALLTPHDYENLALINIKRCLATEGTAGVTHWRTYSDMANSRHDDSTAYDKNTNRKRSGNNSSSRRKTEKEEPNSSKGKNAADYSNCYGSLKYYDIYPLSREMKEQLYKNITPGKGASKSGKEEQEDEETNNVTTSTSDTYEPIEAYCCKMEEDKTSSLPLTLLHHDGERLTSQTMLSMDNLKEFLREYSATPMDDPQDRGDLYLLAPMRLLSPIVEESEPATATNTNVSRDDYEVNNHYELNRSIMTVISEMLVPPPPPPPPSGAQRRPPPAPPSFQAREESQSSLVHTIEELRNSSLCNLFFSATMSNNASYNNSSDAGSGSQHAVPQVPPRSSSSSLRTVVIHEDSEDDEPNNAKSQEVLTGNSGLPAGNTSLATGNRKQSPVKSIRSNTLVPSPARVRSRPAPPLPASSPPPSPPPPPRKSPLLTSAGSRKNILALSDGATASILNTPHKARNSMVLSEVPMRSKSDLDENALHTRRMIRSNSTYLDTEPKPAPPRANISMSSLGLNPSAVGKNLRPSVQNPRLLETNLRPGGQNQSSLGQAQTALGPKPILVTQSNQIGVSSNPGQVSSNPAIPAPNPLLQRLNPQASGINPTMLRLDPGTTTPGLDPRSAALSPSSKYETPTPPLKNNQFVRNSAMMRPRRKFSIIRERFEDTSTGRVLVAPPKLASSLEVDLYQNVSDSDLLHNDLSRISNTDDAVIVPSVVSTPSFMDSKDFVNGGLRPDEQYGFPARLRSRAGWATSSTRNRHSAALVTEMGPASSPSALPPHMNARTNPNRRSLSALGEQYHDFGPKKAPPGIMCPNKENVPPPPRPGPKPVNNTATNRTTLSPRAKIFSDNNNS